MNEFAFVLRAIHFAATVALFGEFAFLLWAALPALSTAPGAGEAETFRRRSIRAAAWSLAVVFVSGLLWLAVESAAMSGMPFASAVNPSTLGAVLGDTLFGRTWLVRFALAAALAVALFFARREAGGRAKALELACGALAAGLLASLAWAGHAAADRGIDRVVHLSADAVHLLAAGAWLGALWPLALVLFRARREAGAPTLRFAARATQRFSAMGVASVGALVATGVANGWYTLGSVPALFGTDYGRLLLAKLALFCAMLALAAFNRLRWTPRLLRGESPLVALARLQRNATAETVLGLAVLGIVGALGVTAPALHVQTVWPFPYTLEWGESSAAAAALLVMALAGAGLVVLAWRKRSRPAAAIGVAGLLAAVAAPIWLFAVPAHPSTYFVSPVRYSAASIARGAPLYDRHCAACHGASGHGDGPAGASLPVRPPDLTRHFLHHREGDMLWWLQHGITGTPMPGFGDRMAEGQLWDVLNLLRAQADVARGKTMDASVEPWRPIVAPDFTFQIARGPQQSLRQYRGRGVVLLVFYALPQARPRLRQLAAAWAEFRRAGVGIIAMPMTSISTASRDDASAADPDPEVILVYSLFARPTADAERPTYDAEFLVDRQGYLRSRWTPGESPDWNRIPELLRQIEILNRENPRPAAYERHVH